MSELNEEVLNTSVVDNQKEQFESFAHFGKFATFGGGASNFSDLTRVTIYKNVYRNESAFAFAPTVVHLDDKENPEEFNNWWALLALVLVIGTAAGNILVCLAITWERRLQNVTNYFLMSLAITDLMVAILVMPLGILTLVRGEILCYQKSL